MPLPSPIAHFLERLRPRRTRRSTGSSVTLEFLEKSRVITILVFIATVTAIVLISSAGARNDLLQALPNQVATVRIAAAAPFSYESTLRTDLLRREMAERVPPVYGVDWEGFRHFETAVTELLAGMETFDRSQAGSPADSAERQQELISLVDAFNARGPYRASTADVATLLRDAEAGARAALFQRGLAALQAIYAEGVHDAMLASPEGTIVFQVARPTGEVATRPVQSMEGATGDLASALAIEGVRREVSLALFRLFRNGLKANLIFDREATARRVAEATRQLQPVVVRVARGETIVEPGVRVAPEQYEMLQAHRHLVLENEESQLDDSLHLYGRVLLVLAMVIACAFYIRIEDRETLQSNGRLTLLALVVILNLALVRAIHSVGGLDIFIGQAGWSSLLPYIAPTAIAPLVVAILIDAGSGIFMALFISIFTGVIYGNRLDLLVLTFLASMVSIFAASEVRKRSRVVRAGAFGGLTIAVFAGLVGVANQLPVSTLLLQMGAGLTSGVITGIVVVGLLPVFESLFKRTTNITLLELTDYNHRLLRRMQLEAPGTYHHSLVVAQLAENACNEIGANPLLARVCALFHDIGKTEKPEYFTENQRDTVNPHDLNNPSLSALIIKSHVKEGVDLAVKHRLPRAVIDVIKQHHGTTLIRYFFQRAKGPGRKPGAPKAGAKGPVPPGLEPAEIAESTYRYDGPKPRFKESAVIALADSVEAASRSLRKVNPQCVGELIDSIFRERIDDGQLDEAPLTFEELAKIRSSFAFTLLNMLHSRVAYPAAEEPADEPKA